MDDDDSLPPQIRPLAGSTRHRLCAGQVCVSVASCVKELLENSLDAQSTRLQMIFIAHGADLIELIDNGQGIAEQDFDKLGLRYHTSKLSQFEDLEQIATYGFRGEALSSICLYADVTIITRHASASIGTKLVFDGEGYITSRIPCPREIGTTVSVRSLFNRFPVRRTELQSHSKREFSQALNVIQSFALISRQVQFLQVSASTDNPLLTLTPSTSLKDTLAQVFGQKILDSIMPIDDDQNREFQFDGFISRPQHGCGRSSSDRQYFYVNNRPIDCAPLTRTINDIYRHFNLNQYPLIVLIIHVRDTRTLDVNCTPDKRTVLLEHLTDLCDQLRLLLNKLFEASSNVYIISTNKRQTTEIDIEQSRPPVKQMKIERFTKKPSQSSDEPVLTTTTKLSGAFNSVNSTKSSSSILSPEDRTLFTFAPHTIAGAQFDDSENDLTLLHGSPSKKDFFDQIKQLKEKENLLVEKPDLIVTTDHDLQKYTSTPKVPPPPPPPSEPASIKVTSYKSCEIKVKFSLTQLKDKYRSISEKKKATTIASSSIPQFEIHLDANSNEEAEDELRRQIDKTDFEKMCVIGQFNRGFILATLADRSPQLFIIDQHAADEIYNFHRLYEQTTISRQPLLHPKPLPLDPSRQVLLQQHLDLFNRLGFDIDIDENETRIDRRCRVLSYPSVAGARSSVFGIDEIDEILSHLSDTSQHSKQEDHYESARLRKVFASKACRMSIMIGTDLTRKQMTNVVRHLSQLAKPWNCPHGRPTIRHVSNLAEATDGFVNDEYHAF